MKASNDDLDWAKRVLQQITHDPDFLRHLRSIQRAHRDAQRAWEERRQGKPPTPPPTAS